ncbi:origin of replication complex subunit 5 [Senna tora]|uniref:Origin of replication complex subunit 5 n=1 Tax=Senna tora TaxID=362788 RepID=A0A835CM60_9FABA|nr:origin of replication complex subunit 5 [Senna tora]
MDREQIPQIPRRTTRYLASLSNSENILHQETSLDPPTINDLLVGGDPISLDDLISTFPGRCSQILELVRLLGPLNLPIFPLFVYGGASTGKTSIILQLFRHLNRPLVYSSCRTCYNQRILFESILNQLFLHRKNAANGYSNAKRCERPSDFVNFLREALTNVINNLKRNSEKLRSSKIAERGIGNMIYLVFDNFQLVREWDKSSTIIPFLFNLYDLLNMPEVGMIFISNTSPDTYYTNMGYVEPVPVYFPDYTEDDIRQIFLRNHTNQKLYSSFLDVVLRPFCRITRQVDELYPAFKPLFEKYCEPLSDRSAVPSEGMKRELFSHIRPHLGSSLNEILKVSSFPSPEVETPKETKRKGNSKKLEKPEEIVELEFHMSRCAKYLLISAFLASRNPATLDDSLFDSTGGSNNQKRKRKPSTKVMEHKESAQEELLMKGPGTFPLERLLAIFKNIAEDPSDEEQIIDGLGIQVGNDKLFFGSDCLESVIEATNFHFLAIDQSKQLRGEALFSSRTDECDLQLVARKQNMRCSAWLRAGVKFTSIISSKKRKPPIGD